MFIVIEASVCSFESSLSSMKFSKRNCFVRGSLLLRIDAFHSNHAVNTFSQVSASVRDMSPLRFVLGFKVLSNHCGLESLEGGVAWLSRCMGLLLLLVCSCGMSSPTFVRDIV